MNILTIIPARAGSKGFPNKNIAKINGLTLIEYAVILSKTSKYCSNTIISTDSPHYESIAIKAGAKSLGLRPDHLSTDSSRTIDVILNLTNNMLEKPEWILLLQPTSPLRTPTDLNNIIELALQSPSIEAVASVSKIIEPHPHKMKVIDDELLISNYISDSSSETPRQLLPPVYQLNGAFYLVKYSAMINYKTLLPPKTYGYIMDHFCNIDTENDYKFLDFLVSKGDVSLYDGFHNQ